MHAWYTYFFMLMSLSLISACEPKPQTSQDSTDSLIVIISGPPNRMDQNLQMTGDQMLLPSPVFNSILPTSAPISGGTRIRIIGSDFREPMRVEIGGQACVSLEIQNSNRMLCEVPAVDMPKEVDVLVAWADMGGESVLTNAFRYYTPLQISEITPNQGWKNGGNTVIIKGDGFIEPTSVKFGRQPAQSVVIDNPQQMTVVVPANQPSLVNVSVYNQNGTFTKNRAYLYQAPLILDQIDPQIGSVLGGDEVKLYGFGLSTSSVVDFDGAQAQVLDGQEEQKLNIKTPAHPEGWSQIQIQNQNGTLSQEQAFLYLPSTDGPFQVLGVVPNLLPSKQGGELIIGGNGFSDQTQVFLSGDPLFCEKLSLQKIKCIAPPRDKGQYQLLIQEGNRSENLDFFFDQPIFIDTLSPSAGAIQGGTLVEIQGEGFTADMQIEVDGIPVAIEADGFESENRIWIKMPAHAAGQVGLWARKQLINGKANSQYFDRAYNYFDSRNQYGGVWGEPIRNNLNINVLNIYDFSPVPDVLIQARTFDQPQSMPLVEGLTDENGRLTLARKDLTAPLHVTAIKSGFSVYTIERLVSENLTIFLYPYVPPDGEGGPQTPPEPIFLSGTVTGISALEKPLEPGIIQVAFVDITHSSPLNRSSLPTPSPQNLLLEDGSFEIITKAGQFALIAMVVRMSVTDYEDYLNQRISYWYMRQKSIPIAFGMIRSLSVSPGGSMSDLNVEIAYPCQSEASVKIDNPSGITLDPTANLQSDQVIGSPMLAQQINSDAPIEFGVRRVIEFGADGYFEWDGAVTGNATQVTSRYLPDFSQLPDDLDLIWIASAENEVKNPSSETYFRQKNINQTVLVTPMLGNIQLLSPLPPMSWELNDPSFDLDPDTEGIQTEPYFDGLLAWDYYPGIDRQSVTLPEMVQITIIQNGFPIWSYTLPGGVKSVQVPNIPVLDGAGLLPGGMYLMMEGIFGEDRINYQNFNWYDLSNTRSVTSYRADLIYKPLE